FDDAADDALHRGEDEVPVEDLDDAAGAELGQGGRLVLGAAAARGHRGDRVGAADRGAGGAGDVEEVQVQVGGDLPADLDPADAVAVRIERRREDGDPELPRQHR